MTKENILTDKEREYLRNVIEPFKDKVRIIQKMQTFSTIMRRHFIGVCLYDDYLTLYNFEENTQFKGMELDKEYTLEDLGLE